MSRLVRGLAVVLVALGASAGCRATTGTGLGERVDDKAITAAVKARLVAEKASNLTRVNVETNGGTVYLIGVVDTAGQRSRVEQIARDATGVKAVVNQLQVQPSGAGAGKG